MQKNIKNIKDSAHIRNKIINTFISSQILFIFKEKLMRTFCLKQNRMKRPKKWKFGLRNSQRKSVTENGTLVCKLWTNICHRSLLFKFLCLNPKDNLTLSTITLEKGIRCTLTTKNENLQSMNCELEESNIFASQNRNYLLTTVVLINNQRTANKDVKNTQNLYLTQRVP